MEPKKSKTRAIQIQFKGETEKVYHALRSAALDHDLDLTGMARMVLIEWVWMYSKRKNKGEGPQAFQLPLFSEMKTENLLTNKKTKKAGKK